MRPITAHQLVANIISLSVFPFAARPMLSLLFGLDDAGFAGFIQTRRQDLPSFIRGGLRP
jgi:TetR/AcrR family transcriptional regulator